MVKLIIFGFLFILFFLFLSRIIMDEKENIIEKFEDGSPKLIHITKFFMGKHHLIRSIEFWEKDKIRYDKEIKNGRPEGKQIFISESDEKTEQWIKNGKRHGKYYQWNSKGELILEEIWNLGEKK